MKMTCRGLEGKTDPRGKDAHFISFISPYNIDFLKYLVTTKRSQEKMNTNEI